MIQDCTQLAGSTWTPVISGAGEGNHDSAVSIVKNSQTASVKLIGVEDTFTAADLTTFSINLSSVADFGAYGSLILSAESSGYPVGLTGGALPMLVSLSDGTNEFVKLPNSSGSYAKFFTCTGASCSLTLFPGAATGIMGDSSASRKQQYLQSVLNSDVSVFSFPRCNWSDSACGMYQNALLVNDSGVYKLRPGVTYTAKYILVADSYTSLGTGSYTGSLTLKTMAKVDPNAGGAADLNVVIVGNKNVEQSRTDKGKQNLNALLQGVHDQYSQAGTNLKLGKVNVVEWCGSQAQTFVNLPLTTMSELFRQGSALVPSSSEGKGINVFLVSTITAGAANNLTVLGVSGGIPGSPFNGTSSSGAVFSTFDSLSSFNPSCNGTGVCNLINQEPSFIDMISTISHEMGHFLGLNHLTESDLSQQDTLADTPAATTKAGEYLSHQDILNTSSCNSVCTVYNSSNTFCPTVAQCQFNHIMWWTSKNYAATGGQGDGNIFSGQSGTLINLNTFAQ